MLAKVVDLDLQKPLQAIYVDSRYSQVLALVRWGDRPLARITLACRPDERLIEVERLYYETFRACGWSLWEHYITGRLGSQIKQAAHSLPPISVVVCTRDRAASLARCLAALRQLDYPRYEVVVIDNCSRDGRVAEVVAESGFRYVREETPGLNWARNRGVSASQFDIIAFIDDDALATSGWLRGIAQGFAEPEIMAVTGMVLPAEVETPAQSHFETYGGMSKGLTAFTVRRSERSEQSLYWASGWGVGANMAFRRDLFEAIGTFDVALDVGTPTNGGGDIDMMYRTVAAGYALRYEPAAMVYHTHRRASAALNQQIYNNGRAFGCYLLTIARNERLKRKQVVWFALRWWIWPWLLYRLARSLITRDWLTLRFVLAEMQGALSAVAAYRTSQALASSLVSSTSQSPGSSGSGCAAGS